MLTMIRTVIAVIIVSVLVLSEEHNEGDEGTCTSSNSTEDKCSEPEVEEGEEKANYEKLKWTDDYDYDIREKLDAADDKISSDREMAAGMFTEILASHPGSNRAHYSLARTYTIMIHEANNTEEKERLCDLAKQSLNTILRKEDNLDIMDDSASNLLLHISETEACFSRADMVDALRVLRRKEKEGRYGSVLCQELLLAGRFQEAMEESEEILSVKPTEFLMNIIKSTSMKMMGKIKEANRFLRGIDFEETIDSLPKNERQSSRNVLTNDINYILSQLHKEGNQSAYEIFSKDSSKLHLIPSALQRPLDHKPELKAQPVWELSDLRPKNRWTNVQSITGLGQSADFLGSFTKNFDEILNESSDLTNQLEEYWTPTSLSKSSHILPLFFYGKKKHEACSKAPKTCKLIKKFKDSSSCKKCLSKLVLLKPLVKQDAFVGPSNTKLRAVLPLKINGPSGVRVGDKTVDFEAGKLVVFDDSFENNLWNESNDDILLLILDFHHPDLSDREKNSNSFTEYIKNKYLIH